MFTLNTPVSITAMEQARASDAAREADPAHDRNATIKAIKDAMKRRSGKPWSVTGGRGTAWGWIHIDAPPARRTSRHKLKEGMPDFPENYEEFDSGEAGGSMSKAETAELARLLDITPGQASGGVGVPASSEYRREYIDRAEGRAPSVIGEPYWLGLNTNKTAMTTPDNYIERQPEGTDAPPNQEDACLVCDKIDCECPPEPPQESKQ